MTIIHNDQEFKEFYYYTASLPPKYPSRYPCICDKVDYDGGLCGDFTRHYVLYFPDNQLTVEQAFIAGINAQWEYLC